MRSPVRASSSSPTGFGQTDLWNRRAAKRAYRGQSKQNGSDDNAAASNDERRPQTQVVAEDSAKQRSHQHGAQTADAEAAVDSPEHMLRSNCLAEAELIDVVDGVGAIAAELLGDQDSRPHQRRGRGEWQKQDRHSHRQGTQDHRWANPEPAAGSVGEKSTQERANAANSVDHSDHAGGEAQFAQAEQVNHGDDALERQLEGDRADRDRPQDRVGRDDPQTIDRFAEHAPAFLDRRTATSGVRIQATMNAETKNETASARIATGAVSNWTSQPAMPKPLTSATAELAANLLLPSSRASPCSKVGRYDW